MKTLNQLFKVLSWVVIAVIAIYLAIAAPILLGYRPMVVLSGSMEPTYPVGSITYYHKCTFDELEEGKPLTFNAGESLVTHRMVTVNGLSRTVITKGDNNATEDPVPVEENQVVGQATDFAVPYAGYFVTYGKKPIVIVIMAIILLLHYVLDGIVSKQKKGEDTNEKREA